MTPLLSIVTITYNHEQYIRQCIEGVLAQKTSFPIEFIIADDCSTDETKSICEEYAKNNPDIIRLISSSANVGAVENEQRALLAAKGKYIATCEGDDYWTDPLKLQKQVDFMAAHPDYSVCFHRYLKHRISDDTWEGDHCDNLFVQDNDEGVEISLNQFAKQWTTQYLTMVFRKDCYDFRTYKKYRYFRDTHQIYHLIKNGKCWLFSFIGGVYNITGNGIYTTIDAYKQELLTAEIDKELWILNKDILWKEEYCHVLQDIVYHYKVWRYPAIALMAYSIVLFFLTFDLSQLLRNIRRII